MMLGVQNMSGLILEGDLGEEIDLWRLTSLSRWSKAKLKSPCYLEELSTAARVFLPCHLLKCQYRVYRNLSYPSYFEGDFLEK